MKARKWLIVIAGCIIITAGLAALKAWQISEAINMAKSFPEPREAVEYVIAEASEWQSTISVTAEIKAVRSIELSNELPGRVQAIGFQSGQRVSKGQLLVQFDTSEEQAQLAAAEADAELARLALQRNQTLVKSGVASAEERDRALAQQKAAEASVDRLQAIIDKKTLRAPFDAISGIHELEVGQFLQANTVITRLVGDSDGVWIDFNLPQQQARAEVGDKVTVSLPQNDNDLFEAQIIARDARVNRMSGNLRYRALIAGNHPSLIPGALATVTVATGAAQSAVSVPISAVRYDAFGANIYILEPAEEGAQAPERARQQAVKLGAEEGEQVIVIEGLKVGDKVATNGAFKLRDGILVVSQPMRDIATQQQTTEQPELTPEQAPQSPAQTTTANAG